MKSSEKYTILLLSVFSSSSLACNWMLQTLPHHMWWRMYELLCLRKRIASAAMPTCSTEVSVTYFFRYFFENRIRATELIRWCPDARNVAEAARTTLCVWSHNKEKYSLYGHFYCDFFAHSYVSGYECIHASYDKCSVSACESTLPMCFATRSQAFRRKQWHFIL